MASNYENLAEKLSCPGSARLIAILEHMMPPEQARVADALPGSPEEVADNTGIEVNKVRSMIDDLFTKGLAFIRGDMSKRSSFRFSRNVVQLHDGILANKNLDPARDQRIFELWQDFCVNEMYPQQAKNSAEGLFVYGRVMPAYNAIKDLPDVQPWENFRQVLKQQTKIATVPCACRWRTRGVGKPCKHTDEAADWKCMQFGKAAEYVIMRGSGKELSLEEAIALADKAEEDGLVRLWAIDQRMTFYSVCQCCDDCCGNFVSNNTYNVSMDKMLAKSRYLAEIDQDACNGCQNCVDRCNFDAIEMVKQGKKYKAVVDQEKCFGCAVCALKCDTGALKIKAAHPVDYVPKEVASQANPSH
ncbi:MAG: 4Fe-4S dicluster domain-containing protein [Bacillota bacterium]